MEEVEPKITVHIYTDSKEHIQDPVVWDMTSLVVMNVFEHGLSFTPYEMNVLWDSLYQIRPKSENCWHEVTMKRKTTNNGLSMPPDEWYELVEIKQIL